MKRSLSMVMALGIGLTVGLTPAQSADPNVTIRVVDNSGNPVANGFARLQESFSQKSLETINGEVSFLLPDGKQGIALRVFPGMSDGNASYTFANFDVQVSGKTEVEIKLPPVMQVSFNLGSTGPKSGHVAFDLQHYNKNNTEGFFGGGMRTNHLLRVKVGATETDVLSHSTYVGFAEKIEGRYLVGDEISPERGLRVRDGQINFTMFRPVPLAQMEERLYNHPVFKPIYDFDDDGFMDYTYVYRYGSTGWKSANVSYAALSAGTIDAPLEGAVSLEIDPVPASISGNTFTLKGRVVSPSPAFLQLHSPITARALMQTPGFPFPVERQIGRANLDSNGNFQIKVTISPAERPWFVTEHFFVSTPLGTSTVNFLLPALVKKYASCSAMNRDFIGGVARSLDSKNKGAKTKQKPSVSAKVYYLNKSLDRDRDGLVCER